MADTTNDKSGLPHKSETIQVTAPLEEKVSHKLPCQQVSLIGAPTDIGAADRGASMGPAALRVEDLGAKIAALGYQVQDIGDVWGPLNPNRANSEEGRHLEETALWCEALRDAMLEAYGEGRIPVTMGGDHCLAIGTLAAAAQNARRAGVPLNVIWLDAHADFNTLGTSPSGNTHGMPVAVAAGLGHPRLLKVADQTPALDASVVTQIGIRSVDAEERKLVKASGMHVYDMRRVDELGMRAVMEETLGRVRARGGHLHVSFDVDFLDPKIAPGVGTTVAGGPTYREAQLCMEMIHDTGMMTSLDIMELNPAHDSQNLTAKVAVRLVRSLFGATILGTD